MVHPVTIGKRTRMSFSKIKEITDMPNLIEVQLDSYKWFLEEGLKEVFEDISSYRRLYRKSYIRICRLLL